MSMMTSQEREKRVVAEAADRYSTSIHEAGHAVVGQALGFVVDEVKLHGGAGGGVCEAVVAPFDTLDNLQRDLSFTLAGRLAVALAEGKELGHLAKVRRVLEEPGGIWLCGTLDLESRSSGMDCDGYRRAAAALLGADELAGCRWMNEAIPAAAGEAVRILRERWDDVESLATRLMAEGELDLTKERRRARDIQNAQRVELENALRTRLARSASKRPRAKKELATSGDLSQRAAAIRDCAHRGEVRMKYAQREVR